jgi:hypothetical protein
MSETTAPRVYSWIDGPPITKLTYEEFLVSKKAFKEAMKAWGEVGDERMDSHKGDALFIARLMKKHASHERMIFEYKLAGLPIALMQIELTDGYLEIKDLFTHPATENAGGIMIEFALNITANPRNAAVMKQNAVVLESYNPASTAAYLALGFEPYRNKMRLRADACDKWELVNERWKLKKCKDKRYLSAP